MAGLGGEVPDFEGLLDSDQGKDTEVTIVEEQQQGGSTAAAVQQEGAGKKRSRQRAAAADKQLTLQAHWLVLRSLSPCFRAKLERWSDCHSSSKKARKQQVGQQQDQAPPYQYSLQLLVPPGQLELGRRLITAMYSSSPDLSDLEALQLVQLVALAECYGVGKVVAAAATQLHQLKVEAMPLDIAAAVFELPEACLALEAVQKVQQAAADKLQQELGDLEVVLGDKVQQLDGLPFGALLQLLRDERTRVASEDTVVYTALRWWEYHPSPAREQQQQQLAAVLRLPHCTATYLAALAGSGASVDQDMAWVYGNRPQLLVYLAGVCGRGSSELLDWLKQHHKDRAAWHLPPRPVSAVQQLHMSWDLPLVELEQFLAGAADKEACLEHNRYGCFWQGRQWWLRFEHNPGGGELSAFVCVRAGSAFVDGSVTLTGLGFSTKRVTFRQVYFAAGRGGSMAEWGPGKDWPQIKAWLMEKGWVHPDGCLHLRATITRVT